MVTHIQIFLNPLFNFQLTVWYLDFWIVVEVELFPYKWIWSQVNNLIHWSDFISLTEDLYKNVKKYGMFTTPFVLFSAGSHLLKINLTTKPYSLRLFSISFSLICGFYHRGLIHTKGLSFMLDLEVFYELIRINVSLFKS